MDRAEIEAKARALGFDHLGVCAVDPLPPEMDRFRDWLARGFHGEMKWIERAAAERLDPSLLFRDARSILVGAIRYAAQPAPSRAPLAGEVSSYAWGDDYHRIVGEKAGRLAAFLRERYDARAAEYVDTGPVLERLWAARAGVGWIGKNALVLNSESGSLIFLAVILTDLDIPVDEPARDQCGACRLCLDACPTGAIVEDRVVDSRLCLSYHTIEVRGSFPEEHREALGARVFGCDECQTVCPWNRSAGPASLPAFLPREGIGRLDLVGLVTMTMADYTERFQGSAMKRATYHGLRRNAAIALGNLLSGRAGGVEGMAPIEAGDRSRALQALGRAASDAEPSVADAAAWALREAEKGARTARPCLTSRPL